MLFPSGERREKNGVPNLCSYLDAESGRIRLSDNEKVLFLIEAQQ